MIVSAGEVTTNPFTRCVATVLKKVDRWTRASDDLAFPLQGTMITGRAGPKPGKPCRCAAELLATIARGRLRIAADI